MISRMGIYRAQTFIERHRRLFVLTGAGCSTNSGIPDYRDHQGNRNERSRLASRRPWPRS